MTKRFILLTVPKSASNYLGNRISKLPDVAYLNTIFSKGFFATHFNMHNSGPTSKTGALTELFNLILSDTKIVNELIRLRTDRASIWLLAIMQMSTNKYLGVKIHPYLDIWYKKDGVIQFALDPNLIVDFFAPKYQWKIFTMSRRNFYEQMASSLLSIKAEYFSQDDLPSEPELFISGKLTNANIDKYKEILSIYKKCYLYIESIKDREEITHLWYEDVIEQKIPNEFLTYFGVDHLPSVENEKLFNRPYEDGFEDYNYFIKTIDEL